MHNSIILTKQVNKMKTIIENIKAIFSTKADKKESVTCNYSNNYYGDQVCQNKH